KHSRDPVASGDVIAQIDTEAKAAAAPSAEKKSPPEKTKTAPPVMPAAQKIAAGAEDRRGIDAPLRRDFLGSRHHRRGGAGHRYLDGPRHRPRRSGHQGRRARAGGKSSRRKAGASATPAARQYR